MVRPVRVTLEPGLYTWRCVSFDGSVTVSPAGRVNGRYVADPSPTFVPVAADNLSAAAITYRASAAEGLQALASATNVLVRDIRSGDRSRAKTAWLVAHLDYERLGAVYDTFGPLNDEINGRPDGLVGGVNSPRFTGFLRVEYALWHDQARVVSNAAAGILERDVQALVEAFPRLPLPITNLATVRANIDGDRTVLLALRPLLVTRDPRLLSTAEAQLTILADQLDTYSSPTGVWTPVESLSVLQNERLDAETDAVLATLAQIPAQLELASGDTS